MPLYTVDPQILATMREKMQASQAHKLRKLGESIRIQLERSDVGAPQAVVLLALCSQGDMEPAQIADHVMIPRQTITSILDKLAALGLVVRTDHPSDRRRKIVCLTQAGFDKACAIWESFHKYELQVMAAFTPREIELFRRLNMKLAGRLAELAREPGGVV